MQKIEKKKKNNKTASLRANMEREDCDQILLFFRRYMRGFFRTRYKFRRVTILPVRFTSCIQI